MSSAIPTAAGVAVTVRGPIPAGEMGITLPHEHLLLRHTPPEVVLDDPDLAAEEVAAFGRAGGGTVVEVTSLGIGRDPEGLQRISERAGVHVIMGSGYYKFRWHPPDMPGKTVADIEEEIVRDLTVGAGDTGIRAGVIGEVGISEFLEPNEEKALTASARAHLRTGAAINLHVHLIDKREEEALRMRVLDILEREGVGLNRVIVSHCEGGDADPAYHERIARRGAYVEYDLFGMDALRGLPIPDYESEARILRRLIDRGLLNRILVSQDICYRKLLRRNGGWGYAHLLKDAVPRLSAAGVSESEIRAITVENPRTVFPFWIGGGR
jgi:phosphotriesterase-related protein